MRSRVLTAVPAIIALGVLVGVGLPALAPPTAHARGAVRVANTADGTAAIDPRYATQLRVSGSGFQAVRGGHGGVYVFFGTVRGRWRPSQGGASGADYLYVPDSESRNNRGYQAFLAFPGSDTAGSAQGRMSADGSWSATVNVPGAVFEAVGRNGAVRRVDCRRVTCGIITIGAHGVVNANNETFTPVRVAELYDQAPGGDPVADDAGREDVSVEGDGGADAADPRTGERTARKPSPVALEVDRASARAGNAMSFTARGLPPGGQVSAVLDDGAAAVGPFLVGDDGRVTGVIVLPVDLVAGTHELRIFGLGEDARTPRTRFAVAAAEPPASATATPPDGPDTPAATSASTGTQEWTERLGPWFFAGAALLFLVVLGTRVLDRGGRRSSSGTT